MEDLCPVHTSNNVEATGNKVGTCFNNVALTLLLVWTELNKKSYVAN